MLRTLLAALLLHANQVVSTERLIDFMWGDEPPATAVASLHNHVMRLRAHLAGGPGRIQAAAPGYVIEVAAAEIDSEVFLRLLVLGREARAAGQWEEAAAELTAGLALWRGDPLEDVFSPVLHEVEVQRLLLLRLEALEARIDTDLQLGRIQEAIADLGVLTSAHPLRERFHAQLMLAYSQAGRRAEALAAYRRARTIIAGELGVEPGAALQQLHQRILAADPAVAAEDPDAAAVGAPGTVRPPAVPVQLPPDTADFTGREAQVGLLCDALGAEPDEARPGAVVVSAVAGMGGIGKTALAVHTAHRLRSRFPDGHLFVSLQGASSPLRPAEVLARILRDLGTPDAAIPASEEERAARYRTLLAARSMLIVLDDARDAAQVRPLLPGTARCAVIVTSRTTLFGLTGAKFLELDALDSHEARALFSAIAGQARTAAEPDATVRVLGSCAGLPLAIRIAAARLASRPNWSIAHLSGILADERARLTELTAGDLAVRASFAVSYDALPPGGRGPARVFRLLGLPRLAELSLPAIAALAGQPASDVAVALEALTDAHLLQSPAADRFGLHDLLRSYAAELAERTDSPDERQAATRRMLRWYGETAITAAQVLEPSYRLPAIVLTRATDPAPADPALASPRQALGWFEAERAGLVAAAGHAAELGLHLFAVQIAVAMWSFFQRTPYAEDSLATSEIGVSSARHLGDDAVLSWALNSLGQAHGVLGHFPDSSRCFTEALHIRQRAGDRTGEAAVLNSLAIGLWRQQRFEEALDHLRAALAIYTALGQRLYAAMVMNNIGENLMHLKRYDEALVNLRRALAIRHETGDRYGEAITEAALGDTCLDLSQFEDAVGHYQRARAAYESTAPEHADHASVLRNLGHALDSLGRAQEAHDTWLTALPILDRNNDPRAAELRTRLTDRTSLSHLAARNPRRPPCPRRRGPGLAHLVRLTTALIGLCPFRRCGHSSAAGPGGRTWDRSSRAGEPGRPCSRRRPGERAGHAAGVLHPVRRARWCRARRAAAAGCEC
jgi:DNA-binding SARP family transcriptional activator